MSADILTRLLSMRFRDVNGIDATPLVYDACAEISRLRARVAELEPDALRYRWLRDGCCHKHSVATRIARDEYGMEWDAEIDAARSA